MAAEVLRPHSSRPGAVLPTTRACLAATAVCTNYTRSRSDSWHKHTTTPHSTPTGPQDICPRISPISFSSPLWLLSSPPFLEASSRPEATYPLSSESYFWLSWGFVNVECHRYHGSHRTLMLSPAFVNGAIHCNHNRSVRFDAFHVKPTSIICDRILSNAANINRIHNATVTVTKFYEINNSRIL